MSLAAPAVSLTPPTTSAWSVRLAERRDILPLARLLHDAFALPGRSPLDAAWTMGRLAIDIETRLTPWDWQRHAQFVAETDGELVAFCELWGEDVVSLGKEGAPTPQPCLFNLCVRADQRRRGVGSELIRECEALSRAWKQRTLFLKVRADNDGAERLYARAGFESVAVREAANVPGWQERWKGETAGGLLLMRKRLGSPLEQAADALQLRPSAPPPAPGFSELNVTIGQVAAYGDPDAWVWFGFLLARNARYLGPAYGAAGAVAGLLTYAAILVAARGPLGVGW